MRFTNKWIEQQAKKLGLTICYVKIGGEGDNENQNNNNRHIRHDATDNKHYSKPRI